VCNACIDGIREWMLGVSVDASVHALLSGIENAVFAQKMQKRVQGKITNYFKPV